MNVVRTSVIVIRALETVIGANCTGTDTVAFCCVLSTIGGRSMMRESSPASIRIWVGTECRPSATTCRSKWSIVTGLGVSSSTHWPEGPPYAVLHAVAGLPSNAADPGGHIAGQMDRRRAP